MPVFPASAMMLHIPDGFLNTIVALVGWAIAVAVLYVALRRANARFDERLVPLAGVMAAFIFAGQMINFPVAGGTSGHLVGATLAFIVLGPSLGMLAMTAVIALQALLFQDGGLLVMGANIIVMGIVPGYLGHLVYKLAEGRARGQRLAVAGVAAWLSIMFAALVTALMLGFSGTSAFTVAVPAMLGIHALIGIGEALITVGALAFILRTRPTLLETGKESARGSWVVAGLVLALIVVLAAPFASGHPDGLEWVAETTGFLDTAQDAPYSILPDYTIPGLGETGLSTIVAGIIGVVVVGGITLVTARSLRRAD